MKGSSPVEMREARHSTLASNRPSIRSFSMRRITLLGVLAVFLFLPSQLRAGPLDTPYQILVSTTNIASIVFSTANFPSPVSSINSNVAQYQWCIDHVVVSANAASTFTMFWATSTISAGTTDYLVVTLANAPYDGQWPYRQPYCAPIGDPILTLKSSVAGSTVTAEGFLFKGMNP